MSRIWVVVVVGLLLGLECIVPRSARAEFGSQRDLCRTMRSSEARKRVLDELRWKKNQLHFETPAGRWGMGLCWWHSRFQRSASYLAYYSPHLTAPSAAEAREIARAIARNERVVEIPGFSNLYEFSQAYRYTIESVMEEGFGRDWYRGIRRSVNPLLKTSRVVDSDLFETMKKLDRLVNGQHVMPYLLVQLPGVVAHSWLVQAVRPIVDKSLPPFFQVPIAYELTVVDGSAEGRNLKVRVNAGEKAIYPARIKGGDAGIDEFYPAPFAVHIDFLGDLEKIEDALARECGYVDRLAPAGGREWGMW